MFIIKFSERKRQMDILRLRIEASSLIEGSILTLLLSAFLFSFVSVS